MTDTSDVVIVGGGAAGCATAYYLATAGVKTTIVERESVASKASGFSAGGLNPLQGAGIPGPLGPLAVQSYLMHLGLWDRLKSESGVDFSPAVISVVSVAFDDSGLPGLQESLELHQAADGAGRGHARLIVNQRHFAEHGAGLKRSQRHFTGLMAFLGEGLKNLDLAGFDNEGLLRRFVLTKHEVALMDGLHRAGLEVLLAMVRFLPALCVAAGLFRRCIGVGRHRFSPKKCH